MRLKQRVVVPLIFLNVVFLTVISPPVFELLSGINYRKKGLGLFDYIFMTSAIVHIILSLYGGGSKGIGD